MVIRHMLVMILEVFAIHDSYGSTTISTTWIMHNNKIINVTRMLHSTETIIFPSYKLKV